MSGSTAAQSKAITPEERKDLMLMSCAEIPESAPKVKADWRSVFVSMVVVMLCHLWFSQSDAQSGLGR
jgi:hypothetical protein